MTAERSTDSYPLMTLEYALDALKVLFGADNVMAEQGHFTIKVKYPGRQALAFVNLTVKQAKFLVAHPISAKDLVDENYPANWPGGRLSRSTVPRPVHRGADPVKFEPPKE